MEIDETTAVDTEISGSEAEQETTADGSESNEYADIADEFAASELDADEDAPLEDEAEQLDEADEDETADSEEEEVIPTEDTAEGEDSETADKEDEANLDDEGEKPEGEDAPEKEEPEAETPEEASNKSPEQQEAERYEAWRTGMETEFQKLYALSEEDSSSMLTEPETVIPKLAAKLHMNIFESLVNSVGAQLPNAVRQVQEVEQLNRANEDAFYNAWPQLKGQDQATLLRLTSAYRQANPTVPLEQAIKEIGATAMVAFRIPFETEVPSTNAPQPPHAPIKSKAQTQRQSRGNEFEELADEFLDEEL